MSGVMVESCNEFLSSQSEVIISEPELALDLLDFPTHERVVSGKLGLGAKTSRYLGCSCVAFLALVR